MLDKEKSRAEFRVFMNADIINEIKKEVKEVTWENNIGYFNIDDEKYEV